MQRFSDASEQESALPDWEQRYMQLGRGAFEGSVKIASFGNVSIIEEKIKVAVGQTTSPPPNNIAIVLPIHASGSGLINGERRRDKAFVHLGGHEITVTGKENCHAYYILIEQMALPEFDPRKISGVVPVPAYPEMQYMASWLASLISTASDMVQRFPGRPEGVIPGLVADRVSEIVSYIGNSNGADPHPLRGKLAYSVFSRARHVINDSDETFLSVASIAQQIGIPAYILRSAFLQVTGMTPRVWLRQRALDRARRAMLAPDLARRGVSHIAMECGFFHLGRFAAYYAETFGEPPAKTIRKVLEGA
ncbi:helix-turn-helix domain-containing protein [Gluconacetobacter tumulicola]|uniref:Helix-turn-helix transcriptional regulator n=1 Tax=Gluconacetobacter tumulicola TaxID=1017177 RepID=A0A7W4JAW4_9PROT|nr:helix-turn-helix domain-containing protein [Gluconacetobacter tumulicola]MBB2177724.1 helix-turn-helix transcriptional regulator [Gluconacetobacter tumulicola]